jgi:opacity protein-like surface antigen
MPNRFASVLIAVLLSSASAAALAQPAPAAKAAPTAPSGATVGGLTVIGRKPQKAAELFERRVRLRPLSRS